ncbi:TPA: hypothetical protein VYN37_001290, partial [Streptococcus pneumoniae]|nr:hypothetical protein [Streptococcus pneumoniae]
LAIKTYILDISALYSELDYNKYWYILHTLIYMLMIFPIQILYQNLREALIEDNNNGWNIFIPATYYYTEIQSTTNLGIKLLVCIWIMGFEFFLLPKLIKLKEQNLV